MAKPDGGPAHPHPMTHATATMACPRCNARVTSFGMSLRDYFAGQALMGWIAGEGLAAVAAKSPQADVVRSLAQHAYEFADAMIEQREKD